MRFPGLAEGGGWETQVPATALRLLLGGGNVGGGLKAAALCEINGMTVHMAYVPLKSRLGWKLLYTPKALWPKNSKPVFKPWCFVVNI